MTIVEIFAPTWCRGPVAEHHHDAELCRLAEDVRWLEGEGVPVTVTTLTDEPARFVEHDAVRFLMNVLGREVLPVVLVDGVMRAHRICPDREQLAGWVGLDHHVAVPPDDAVGAAIPSQASAHAFAPVPAEHVRRAALRAGLRAERPLAAARLR